MAYCPRHDRTVYGDSCPQCSAEEAALTRKGVERRFRVNVSALENGQVINGFVTLMAKSGKEAKLAAKGVYEKGGFDTARDIIVESGGWMALNSRSRNHAAFHVEFAFSY